MKRLLKCVSAVSLAAGTLGCGETRQACKLHRVTTQIGSEPAIVLHSREEDAIEVAFEPWLEHAISGSHVIPLGDRLPFQMDARARLAHADLAIR